MKRRRKNSSESSPILQFQPPVYHWELTQRKFKTGFFIFRVPHSSQEHKNIIGWSEDLEGAKILKKLLAGRYREIVIDHAENIWEFEMEQV